LSGVGRLRVRELTPGTVDRFIQRIAEQHGNSSAKMARSVVSGVAAFAVRMDLLAHNPARQAAPISRKTKRAPRALNLAQIRQLRALLTYDDRAIVLDLPDLVDMMIATGLRIGEAIAVTWAALDLDNATVEVRATVIRVNGKRLILKPAPKTEAGFRTLVLPKWCVDMLLRRQKTASGAMVFPSPKGHLRDPKNTNRDLRAAYDNAGLTTIVSHTFRKSVATLMDEAGLTSRKAADQLGHSQVSMTQNNYFGRDTLDTGAAAVLEAIGD
jgi:integrase